MIGRTVVHALMAGSLLACSGRARSALAKLVRKRSTDTKFLPVIRVSPHITPGDWRAGRSGNGSWILSDQGAREAPGQSGWR